MELIGNNACYGVAPVEFSRRRSVLPIVDDERAFPLGLGGLLPVVTTRKSGEVRTVYGFWLAAPETPETPESAETGAACDSATPDEPSDSIETISVDDPAPLAESPEGSEAPVVALPASIEAMVQDGLAEVEDVTYLLNDLLCDAEDICHKHLKRFESLHMTIAPSGLGFTHVEVHPINEFGERSTAPIHLHIESGPEPGAPGTMSAVVKYARNGYPERIVIIDYVDKDYNVRVDATPTRRGQYEVRKIEDSPHGERRSRVLYDRWA